MRSSSMSHEKQATCVELDNFSSLFYLTLPPIPILWLGHVAFLVLNFLNQALLPSHIYWSNLNVALSLKLFKSYFEWCNCSIITAYTHTHTHTQTHRHAPPPFLCLLPGCDGSEEVLYLFIYRSLLEFPSHVPNKGHGLWHISCFFTWQTNRRQASFMGLQQH
jgi:hypothetical protein